MSNALFKHYQQLQYRLTAVFSLSCLLIILIYMGMITLSQYLARFSFERAIDERLEGMTVEPAQPGNTFFSCQGSRCHSETANSQLLETLALKLREETPRQLPAPAVVRTSFAQYNRHTWVNLWIFNFFIWLLGTLGGYFLTGWLLKPAARAAQDQADFLANASHELKTPITTIKTELTLLEGEKLPAATQESLKVVAQENQTLQNLVDKLLLATVRQATVKELVDLRPLIEERLAVHQKNYLARGLNFKFAGAPLQLQTDPYKLTQILDLLLDNAGKYAKTETEVTVKAKQNDKTVGLQVINQGLGIAKADQEKIFQRFYRVTDKKVQLQPGSGLGLALARDLAAQLGGSLTLKSGAASATCFQVNLPLTK